LAAAEAAASSFDKLRMRLDFAMDVMKSLSHAEVLIPSLSRDEARATVVQPVVRCLDSLLRRL